MTVMHMEPVFVPLPLGGVVSPKITSRLVDSPPGLDKKESARKGKTTASASPAPQGLGAVGTVFLAAAKSELHSVSLSVDVVVASGRAHDAKCDEQPSHVPSPRAVCAGGATPAAFRVNCAVTAPVRGRTPRVGKEERSQKDRWWTNAEVPQLCPLTNFPIAMLPYPPFKLREDPNRPNPHRLVDGKVMALRVIVSGRFAAGGRDLTPSDIGALDDYLHRCKLGPHRPGRALALAAQASSCTGNLGRRKQAAMELGRLIKGAYAELTKIQRIQENRLAQMYAAGYLPSPPMVERSVSGGGGSSVTSTASGTSETSSAGDAEEL